MIIYYIDDDPAVVAVSSEESGNTFSNRRMGVGIEIYGTVKHHPPLDPNGVFQIRSTFQGIGNKVSYGQFFVGS